MVYLVLQPALSSLEQAQNISGAFNSKAAAYFISFAIMLLCALTPLPAELIALANTFVFSPVEAFLLTWFSALLSTCIGYEFGRLNTITPCNYKHDNKICNWLNTYGYKALAVMRLIPVLPFFAVNICSGVLKLNRYKYTTITAVAITPAVALLALFPQWFLQP